jgi:hypothetical protein
MRPARMLYLDFLGVWEEVCARFLRRVAQENGCADYRGKWRCCLVWIVIGPVSFDIRR